MQKAFINSPLGVLEIIASESGIYEINFVPEAKADRPGQIKDKFIALCAKELELYFAKKLKNFSVPLDIGGTEFERSVYNALLKIKYGCTATYKDIAKSIGKDRAFRAVGNANGKNKIPIIIPCHRVVASNGLGGYSGGLDKKIFLLNLEK